LEYSGVKPTPQNVKAIVQDYYDESQLGKRRKPRYYQELAVNRAVEAVVNGKRRVLITQATGTGKTFTSLQLVYKLWKSGVSKRILFIVDRNLLADQAFQDFNNAFDKDSCYRMSPDDETFPLGRAVYFGIYQTLVGIDEEGNPTNFTDKQLIDLPVIDNPGNGSEPSGIGVFAKNTIEPHKAPFEFTSTKVNKYINPRAMVMYQDANDPDADPEAATLNKQFYFSQDLETSRDGAYLNMTANQSNATSGNFINRTFNPKTQKTTYRYYDNSTGRWIFSEQDATEAESKPMNVSQIVFGRGEGARFVYKWMPFIGRRW
jgi:hypothetical protein